MRRALLLAALLPSLLASQSALAEETGPAGKPRFQIGGGLYYMDASSNLRVDGSGGQVGTAVGSDDLGLPERKALWVTSLNWNLNQRHTLALGRFRLGRDGVVQLSADLEVGDEVFPVSATVETQSITEVTYLQYRYSLVQDEVQELRLGGGLHHTSFSTRIRTDDGTLEFQQAMDQPLPYVGGRYTRRMTDDWSFTTSYEFFSLNEDDWDGEIHNASLGAVWDGAAAWQIFLAYHYFDVTYTDYDARFVGRLSYRYHGPMVIALYGFGG